MAKDKSSSVEDAELADDVIAEVSQSPADDAPLTDPVDEHADEHASDIEQDLEAQAQDDPRDFDHEDDVADDAAHTDVHDDGYVEERGMGFAARLLWLLVLLFAGAGLALWGGPKLAPMLPQPLQPLAKYLTPGAAETQTALQDLRTETQARFEALPAPLEQASVDAAVTQAVDSARADFTARADGLSADVAALTDKVTAADSGEIEARLAAIETRVTGMGAEFAALQDALGALETSGNGASDISAELTAKIAAYAAGLEGLKAELQAISSQNGALRQRVDEVEAASNRRVSEADARAQEMEANAVSAAQLAEIEAAMRKVRARLDSGGAYGQELANVATIVEGVELPEGLAAHADAGIPPAATLVDGFTDAANTAIRSAIKSDAEEGTISGLSAFLKSQVVTRSLTPQDGDSTDAVLSRMDASLRNQDYSSLLTEASALPEPAAAAMADWLAQARTRAEALAAFDALEAALAARN